MSSIIDGSEFSNYRVTGMSIGVAKKENRDKIKARFVVLTIRNTKKGLGAPIRHILFEDDLDAGAIDVLTNHRMLNDSGEPIKDPKGGYPINMKSLRDSEEDFKIFEPILEIPGGMVEDYKLKKGPCYANDVNGERVKNRFQEPVVKDVIPVFTQVDKFIVSNDGTMVPKYMPKMGLEERGSRLEDIFYREAVNKVQTPAQGTPVNDTAAGLPETDPF